MPQLIKITKIKVNPQNPRIIKDDKFKKLVQSIKDFPEMLERRPIVVNRDMIILGGNMRFRAAIEAGMLEIPVDVVDWSEEKQKEFIIKDNISGGEWDWDVLSNDWDTDKLEEWGLDIPNYEGVENEEVEPETNQSWFLNIRCANEIQCQALYEKFLQDGLDVKIVT